ncbi:MAG: 2-nitropropane dioxygenase [Pyrinomonadaceae bacterium]
MANQYRILCPCCQATIIIDAETGAIISHEEKKKVTGSFDEMKKDLERQRQARDQIFTQELGSIKDRERLLEEKFRDAFKKASKADLDKPFKNPLDLD